MESRFEIAQLFWNLAYVVVDEMHASINEVRGNPPRFGGEPVLPSEGMVQAPLDCAETVPVTWSIPTQRIDDSLTSVGGMKFWFTSSDNADKFKTRSKACRSNHIRNKLIVT